MVASHAASNSPFLKGDIIVETVVNCFVPSLYYLKLTATTLFVFSVFNVQQVPRISNS